MRREVTTHTSAGPPRVRGYLHLSRDESSVLPSEICPRGGGFFFSLSFISIISFVAFHATLRRGQALLGFSSTRRASTPQEAGEFQMGDRSRGSRGEQ